MSFDITKVFDDKLAVREAFNSPVPNSVPEPMEADARALLNKPKTEEESEGFQIRIFNHGGFVIVEFSQSVPYLKMTKRTAREFAKQIIKKAI